jgi:hypothetical protein
MNTRNLLLSIGVAALATVNVMASDVALSPRALDHQAKIIPGTNNDPNLTAAAPRSMSPRMAENQIKTVAGADKSVNPSLLCARNMSGTPKAAGECADHPGAPMPCCVVAAAK